MILKNVQKYANAICKPLGFQLLSTASQWQTAFDPAHCSMQDPALRKMLISELAEIAQAQFASKARGLAGRVMNFEDEVEMFFDVYAHRPFTMNAGGSGFHNAFWLFLSARSLQPELIVESGVWKGHTTWLFEQACPQAKVLGFDINTRRVEPCHARAKFYEHDWTEFAFTDVHPEKSLVYFDCHVNNAARILEAKARGFKHLLFDDNAPLHKLYGYKYPGFPTASMTWEGVGDASATEVVWTFAGKEVRYALDPAQLKSARQLMQCHEVFPDVGALTRYGGFSFLTYVGLV